MLPVERVLVLIGTLTLVACQAGATPEPTAANATLYRSAGSKQCGEGGVTPQEVRKELAAIGITPVEVGCGNDGRSYAATCGAPDGRIVVIQVRREQADAAQAKGFKPLTELPDAARAACR